MYKLGDLKMSLLSTIQLPTPFYNNQIVILYTV